MYKYLMLNALFVAFAALAGWYLRRFVHWKIELRVLAVVLLLTAIFDTLLIHIGIFAYRPEYILGIYIGKAPVEDFAYPLVAALVVPALWRKLKVHDAKPKV